MGWTTLTLRKAELRRDHAYYEQRNLQISREKRQITRQLHYEQTVYNNDKSQELRDAKADLDALRESRPSTKDPGYSDWQQQYSDAKEDYEAQKVDINDYYDGLMSELEEESSEREAMLEQEQTEIEALMENISAEIEAVGQAVSSDIQSTTPKFA